MIRAHLIRLNPTPEQADYFRKACGAARFVFNWALARWKDYRAQGKPVSMHELKHEFNHLATAHDRQRLQPDIHPHRLSNRCSCFGQVMAMPTCDRVTPVISTSMVETTMLVRSR